MTPRTITVGDATIFYREAGDERAPAVLLLHGFPSSSHMFRELMPILGGRYRVVAPDLPGFGFTESPACRSFEELATVVEAFTEALGLARYVLYVFDYGAPVGFRLALRHPERIVAILSQNGNAYVEGLNVEAWAPIRRYWTAPTGANREALRRFTTPEAIRDLHYLHGVPDPTRVAPEAYTLDAALLARPGIDEIQLDLLLDYATNVELYPRIQAYLRRHAPPFLAAWGEHDLFFLPAGASAFARDVPDARIRFYDTGHFALETHAQEIGHDIVEFLDENRIER